MIATHTLGEVVTSGDQLDAWGYRHIPKFRGVITKEELVHQKFLPGESFILNLNDVNGGTHWVAFRISTARHAAIYVDSFGMPPLDVVIKAAHAHGLDIWYSDIDQQKLTETNCGQRALSNLLALAVARDDWEEFKRLGRE